MLFSTVFIVLLRARNPTVESGQVKPNMSWTGSYGRGTQLPHQVRLKNTAGKGAQSANGQEGPVLWRGP